MGYQSNPRGKSTDREPAHRRTGTTPSGDHLAEVEFPLPPLPEQQAVATVLSDMDSEITALEHHLDKTGAIKQGMMQQLLTGSIRLSILNNDMEDDDHDA